MIVLGIHQETAGAVYFDIHHLQVRQEEQQPCYMVSGTLGDGWYEGEISVNFDDGMEVTFADEWLDIAALREFFGRVDREEVCAALAEVLDEAICSFAPAQCPPVALPACGYPADGPGREAMNRSGYCCGSSARHPGVSSGEPWWKAA
jgi:hypothetical protein